MSLFGSLNTAVSGLNAQSTAFGNISENVANSETVGYKEVDTDFADYLTTSNATTNVAGSVAATPSYENNVQGTITSTSDSLNLAISGNGFFIVNTAESVNSDGTPDINTATDYYTRAGNFALDSSGYLQNSEGDYLDGYALNSTTGAISTSTLEPIQISTVDSPPTATQNINFAGNLPTTLTSDSTLSSSTDIYNSDGAEIPITMVWSNPAQSDLSTSTTSVSSSNPWTLTLYDGSASTGTEIGTVDVTFNADGTLETIGNATSPNAATSTTSSTVTGSPGVSIPLANSTGNYTGTSGSAASFEFTLPNSSSTINFNLGDFDSSTGTTQFSGSNLQVSTLTQDGTPVGAYSGTSINTQGQVIVSYSNGTTALVAQIPLANFANPDGLQSENDQNYQTTLQSGSASISTVGTDGLGSLVTSSVESSNVDISSQLTQLIVAQEAYSANTKVISTDQTLLQSTLDMIS